METETFPLAFTIIAQAKSDDKTTRICQSNFQWNTNNIYTMNSSPFITTTKLLFQLNFKQD